MRTETTGKPTTKKQTTTKTPKIHILALLCETLIKTNPSLVACSEVKHTHAHRIPMSLGQIQLSRQCSETHNFVHLAA